MHGLRLIRSELGNQLVTLGGHLVETTRQEPGALYRPYFMSLVKTKYCVVLGSCP